MIAIKPSKGAFIVLILIAICVFAASGFVYYKQANALKSVRNKLEAKQALLKDSQQMAMKLSETEQRYLECKSKLGFLEQGVSEKSYVPTLLRQLEELAKSDKLRVLGVRPIPVKIEPQSPPPTNDSSAKGTEVVVQKKVEPYDKLDIDFEISGKYMNVVSFLEDTTTFPKIIAVKSIQMSPTGKEERSSPDLSVKLNATAFILKEQKKPNVAKDKTDMVTVTARAPEVDHGN